MITTKEPHIILLHTDPLEGKETLVTMDNIVDKCNIYSFVLKMAKVSYTPISDKKVIQVGAYTPEIVERLAKANIQHLVIDRPHYARIGKVLTCGKTTDKNGYTILMMGNNCHRVEATPLKRNTAKQLQVGTGRVTPYQPIARKEHEPLAGSFSNLVGFTCNFKLLAILFQVFYKEEERADETKAHDKLHQQNTKKRANPIIPGASLCTPTAVSPTPKQEQIEQTSHMTTDDP